ncbi:cytochrome P450 3A11 [Trichonephila clavipes]|nr:cytochrome P450 3A11 [Trichonephila clavipes]
MLDTEFMFEPLVAAFLILVSTVLLYWYSTHTFDFFKKRNIPYAKPLPLLGSILDVVRKPLHEIENLRRQKYGRIYGHFEGIRPVLSVADPILLRDILVKDFHIFPQRRILRNQYAEQPPLAVITAFMCLDIKSNRDRVACTGIDNMQIQHDATAHQP